MPDNAAAPKQTASEPSANSSTFSPTSSSNGTLSFGLRPSHHNNAPRRPTATAILKTIEAAFAPAPPSDVTMISIGTTAMSCAIITPTVIRPGMRRSAPASSSIFIATTVLDNAMMKPRIIASAREEEVSQAIPAPSSIAAMSCPAATVTAGLSVATKAFTDSSVPMKKSSIRTPISASVVTLSFELIRPKPVGPMIMPARMKPTSGGCFKRISPSPASTAIAITIAMSTSGTP